MQWFIFHFSEAGGLKSFHFYLFIYLFIYLFLCLFSLAAIRTWLRVEIAAERVVHFFWLDGKQHSQSVVKEEGGGGGGCGGE